MLSLGDKSQVTANAAVVCCLHSRYKEMLHFSWRLVKTKSLPLPPLFLQVFESHAFLPPPLVGVFCGLHGKSP